MNRLATDKRTAVIAALIEGTSTNETCRMTGIAKHTVLKLRKDMGCAAASYHNFPRPQSQGTPSTVRWNLVVCRREDEKHERGKDKAGLGTISALHSWNAAIFRCEWECAVSHDWPTDLSKKLENQWHMVALYFMHYNFFRVHKTLRVTRAMEAGLPDHVWDIEELILTLK
jgi:hypothetical protein